MDVEIPQISSQWGEIFFTNNYHEVFFVKTTISKDTNNNFTSYKRIKIPYFLDDNPHGV